jgi:hypothetical protein
MGKPVRFFFTENGTEPGNFGENAIPLRGRREGRTYVF